MGHRCYLCGTPLTDQESVMFGIGPTCYKTLCRWEAIETIHRKIADPKYVMNTDFIFEKEYHALYSFYQRNPKQREKDFKDLKENKPFKKELEIYNEIRELHFKRLHISHRIEKELKVIKDNKLSKSHPEYKKRMVDIRSLLTKFESEMAYRLLSVKNDNGKRFISDLIENLRKEKLLY